MNYLSIDLFLKELDCNYFSINSVILFGSFLNRSEFSDVDVIIVYDELPAVLQGRKISREFYGRFCKPLHIQSFTVSQSRELNAFLRRAKHWECIYGKRPSP